jgi:GcrA cell cycle regulator
MKKGSKHSEETRQRMLAKAAPLRKRFESNILGEPNSGCWLWMAACDKHGYGHLRVGGHLMSATHVSLELRLWLLGLTCSQIAKLIPGATRSGISGKARRLGLEPRAAVPPPGNHKERSAKPEPSPPKPLPLVPAPELKAHKSVKRLKLGPHACRWPMANYDLRHGFPSCGQKTDGRVYCEFHAQRAWQGKRP